LEQLSALVNEPDSVVEPGWQKLAKKAGRFLGVGESDGITDMMTPMGAGKVPLAALVSIFRDKATRELSTRAFKESAEKMGIANLPTAANTFADKYPRVAAHMRLDPTPTDVGDIAAVALPRPGVYRPINMRLSTHGRDLADNSMEQAQDMVFHEGTHVAQALGNRRTANLYENASELMGYEDNPFEVNARRAANKAIGKSVGPPQNAIQALEQQVSKPAGLLEQLWTTITGGPKPSSPKAEIERILASRK